MAKTKRSTILIVVSVCAAILLLINYFISQKERLGLLSGLNKAQEQVASLANEKQSLLAALEKEKAENSKLQAELKTTQEKLTQIDVSLAQAQKIVEDLNSQVNSLKAENTALSAEKDDLNANLAQFAQDNELMKARLSSMEELKKAIGELKKKMREAAKLIIRKISPEDRVYGNRGFLMKEGKSTYPAKVKIEVKPLPSND